MLDQQQKNRAMFEGLVYNEAGEPAHVVTIGGEAHYAIPDDSFLRHVQAQQVDDAVIAHMKERILPMQDELVRAMLQMLGKDDIFTKAALDASVRNFDQQIRQTDPDQWVPWLRLYGFRIIVDVHGQVVDILYPSGAIGEEGDDDDDL